ncbi:MAG: polymer-forming cytoskeletal protein [Desulfuromonadaceae bacterium]|nr:polymer-forming cytoskeletal protein [Desulfuromonadaceae bacterium]
MFGRGDKKDIAKEKDKGKGEVEAFLGAGSSFEGKLVFEDIVRLDGDFSGEIVSRGTLIIGAEANVKAELKVDTLIMSGAFQGNIEAITRVILRKPARITGNIVTPMLLVEEGVIINGSLEMREKSEMRTEQD